MLLLELLLLLELKPNGRRRVAAAVAAIAAAGGVTARRAGCCCWSCCCYCWRKPGGGDVLLLLLLELEKLSEGMKPPPGAGPGRWPPDAAWVISRTASSSFCLFTSSSLCFTLGEVFGNNACEFAPFEGVAVRPVRKWQESQLCSSSLLLPTHRPAAGPVGHASRQPGGVLPPGRADRRDSP